MTVHHSCRRPITAFRAKVPSLAAAFCVIGCFGLMIAALLALAAPAASAARSRDDKSQPAPTTKLHLRVLTDAGKPVGNASVYVRFYTDGGFMHHDRLAELDLKTNQDGTVKVPPVPQGKILIQVIATGWHTFGKWYDIDQDEESIEIKLEPPPHWY
jgi:hypothetical protein